MKIEECIRNSRGAITLQRLYANKEMKEDAISTLFGAINNPTMQVNKTRDITLGFIKLKKDCRL